jgi:hypothetical protein
MELAFDQLPSVRPLSNVVNCNVEWFLPTSVIVGNCRAEGRIATRSGSEVGWSITS